MRSAELIQQEHNYSLPGGGETRSQEKDIHGAACCPAHSLTTTAMSHVEEEQVKDRHGASVAACCPADSLTRAAVSHVEEEQDEDRHGSGVVTCCSADNLTVTSVVVPYVKEDEELLSHLETLEEIKYELCCNAPAELIGPNGDANYLTR